MRHYSQGFTLIELLGV
ncbi:MAG: prepilin-type N-terminal cleavage/methylation domain-containing protein, partial [Candidatus Pelagibacter sp. TMED253]